MIWGVCSHSVATTMEAVRRAGVTPRLLLPGMRPASHACTVVPSVRDLRHHAPQLARFRTRVIAVDGEAELKRVVDMRILDRYPPDQGWSPRPIRVSELAAVLHEPAPVLGTVLFNASTLVEALVVDAKSRGVLDKMLSYTQRLPKPDRERCQRTVAEFLSGRISSKTMASRTGPTREQLLPVHDAMVQAFTGPSGEALSRAISLVRGGESVLDACTATGADAFEIRYILRSLEMHA